jgi:hypothetical protein
MTPEADQIILRFFGACEMPEAEAALRDLVAHDDANPDAAADHEPIGDLYSELAADHFEHDEFDEAIRLQRLAIEQPCTSREREVGALRGYRYASGDQEKALADLKRSRSGEPTDAALLSAFAEAIDPFDAERALPIHDEAVAIARASGDAELLQQTQIPRALLRDELELAHDADDVAGFAALDELNRQIREAEVAESQQYFVPRDQLAAAAAHWPDDVDELGLSDPDTYYPRLEQFWRALPATGNALTLWPIDVAAFSDASPDEIGPEGIIGALPDELAAAVVDAAAPISWPPGRNDECWCGSERKYKRCCGAAA